MPKKQDTALEPGTVLIPAVQDSTPAIDREEIERLAYSYWQERGCPIGSPDEDWYRAEKDLQKLVVAVVAAATA